MERLAIRRIGGWLSLIPRNPNYFSISRKCHKPDHAVPTTLNIGISSVQFHKHLGICLSCDGSWDHQIQPIGEKAWKIVVLRRLKFLLDRLSLQTIYFSFIRHILKYGDSIWNNTHEYFACIPYGRNKQSPNEVARIVTGCAKLVSLSDLSRESDWETLRERRNKHKLILFFKVVNGLVPKYTCSLIPTAIGNNTTYNLRNSNGLANIVCRNSLCMNFFLPSAVNALNSLPQATRETDSHRLNVC